MCAIDGDRADLWQDDVRRARKPHRCASCGRTIPAGESYTSLFTIFEGEADRCACCAACWSDLNEFGEAHRFTPHPTTFAEELAACVEESSVYDEELDERVPAGEWAPMLARLREREERARAVTR